MQEHQIDVVRAKQAEGLVDGGGGPLLGEVDRGDLRRQEDVLPGQTGVSQAGADLLLVGVGLGGIDHPVADLESFVHAAQGLLRRGLEDAVSEDRHLDAVRQGAGGNSGRGIAHCLCAP